MRLAARPALRPPQTPIAPCAATPIAPCAATPIAAVRRDADRSVRRDADRSLRRDAERPLRRDAERNRRLILDAARELFEQRGLGVTLNDIAHHAGVGVGTVYRRFPDKEQLIDALLEDRIADLVGSAREGALDPDPWHGLTTFLERSPRAPGRRPRRGRTSGC